MAAVPATPASYHGRGAGPKGFRALCLTVGLANPAGMDDPPDKPRGGDPHGSVVSEPLSRAIGGRYLTYALSTIMHRALPDARDGLKPVHRRILFAMRELRLASNGGFRKSAKISGDVMGNYHPHGDAAIYDAMARLAQDFNVRYPLVDGQGNFGNVDGDNPAAARYTEARMTAAAEALLAGLDEDAVDFRDNYDGTLREPVVLPAAFPNLLANGAAGIAVGMATNIPPHNLDELIAACLHLLKSPNARDETLLEHVPGPDFPTGGVIVEPPESILESYRTGRGAFRLRARHAIEDLGQGRWQVIVTEIPYQVQKGKLIEKLADLVTSKKVPILADIRDESADDIRIVLEPRTRNVDPDVLMQTLYRLSELETRFPLNMNVLIDGVTPRVCGLREVLQAFLDHRRDVLLRRSRHRMERIDHRLEVLEGFVVAFLNLDRVIDIIRYDDAPKQALMHEDWGTGPGRARDEADYRSPLPTGRDATLTEVQAEAILNMRLRALRRLEELALLRERDTLMAERAGLEDLLETEATQWKAIADELREVRRAFGKATPLGRRRSDFAVAAEVADVPLEAMIDREPITVVCSAMGWIRALSGHQPPGKELKFKDGDGPAFLFHAETTDRLIVWGSDGRAFTLQASQLPGGRGMGEPLRLMIDLPDGTGIVDILIHRPDRRLLLASSAGDGFVAPEGEMVALRRAGKQVLNVRPGVTALRPVVAEGDHVACIGDNRKMLVFPLADLPEMPRGKGVRLQRYKDGGLSDVTVLMLADGLRWSDPAGRTRAPGGAGRMARDARAVRSHGPPRLPPRQPLRPGRAEAVACHGRSPSLPPGRDRQERGPDGHDDGQASLRLAGSRWGRDAFRLRHARPAGRGPARHGELPAGLRGHGLGQRQEDPAVAQCHGGRSQIGHECRDHPPVRSLRGRQAVLHRDQHRRLRARAAGHPHRADAEVDHGRLRQRVDRPADRQDRRARADHHLRGGGHAPARIRADEGRRRAAPDAEPEHREEGAVLDAPEPRMVRHPGLTVGVAGASRIASVPPLPRCRAVARCPATQFREPRRFPSGF